MATLTGAVPVLRARASGPAEAFYGALGFRVASAYRPAGGADPAYLVLARDGVVLHVSSFPGDGVPGGVVNLYVDDLDALHGDLVEAGVAGAMPPTDQSWGTRELYVEDPDGNSVRFVEGAAG